MSDNNGTIIASISIGRLMEKIESAVKKAHTEAKKAKPETLYSKTAAARLMGISYNTVARLIENKRIAATSDGQFISQQAIDDFLNLKK